MPQDPHDLVARLERQRDRLLAELDTELGIEPDTIRYAALLDIDRVLAANRPPVPLPPDATMPAGLLQAVWDATQDAGGTTVIGDAALAAVKHFYPAPA